MTATELLKTQIDDAGYQLSKVLEGIDESAADIRPSDKIMTAREQVVHLTECYVALMADVAGEKYEWGTFVPADNAWDALLGAWKAKRAEAVEKSLTTPDSEGKTSSFVVAHDYYHVGQLCLIRMSVHPDWDPYSIYNWS